MPESGNVSDNGDVEHTSKEHLHGDKASASDLDVERNDLPDQLHDADDLSTSTPRDAEDEKAAPPALKPHQDAGKGAVPDGGLLAWLQVVGGWCLFFNTWGILK